jgi:hypothetical protein
MLKNVIQKTLFFQKPDYIHHNPVSKNWQLIKDFTEYEYSSASFYEKGIRNMKSWYIFLMHYTMKSLGLPTHKALL